VVNEKDLSLNNKELIYIKIRLSYKVVGNTTPKKVKVLNKK